MRKALLHLFGREAQCREACKFPRDWYLCSCFMSRNSFPGYIGNILLVNPDKQGPIFHFCAFYILTPFNKSSNLNKYCVLLKTNNFINRDIYLTIKEIFLGRAQMCALRISYSLECLGEGGILIFFFLFRFFGLLKI